jgi:hypothetical protein
VIPHFLHQALRVTLAASVCVLLVRTCGTVTAAAVWVGVSLVMSVLGVVLLRTSAVGRLTWKNYLAGYFAPWGVRVGGGKLWPIAVVSWAVWLAVGGGVFVLVPETGEMTGGDITLRVLLGLSWAVAGYTVGYLIATRVRSFPAGSSSGRRLLLLAGVVAALIAASVALYLFGFTLFALLVTGGPVLLLSGGYGLFVLVLVVFGRGARWN